MIRIFTAFQRNPLHPRLEMQLKHFEQTGEAVDCSFDEGIPASSFSKLKTKLWLKYFRFDLIDAYKQRIGENETVHIYDLRLLPLAKTAKRKGNKVIYETLDDNVPLHYDALCKKSKLFRLMPFIERFMARKERKLIEKYVDHAIVNSPNLMKLSPQKATLIYYASPFEGFTFPAFDASKETAFLYLGKLTRSKGAEHYALLLEQFGIPMHFFGQTKDSYSARLLETNRQIINHGNKSSSELNDALKTLAAEVNLIGLSIIIPENESYALQEANKDIDYLCMGLPFVGNERKPTFDKIQKGAGVLYSDTEALRKLIANENDTYNTISKLQQALYQNVYSKANFIRLLEEVYKKK